MRWFKHMTNARHDIFLKEIRHEFGPLGVMAWWNLVEYVAEALKDSNPRPHILGTPQSFVEECYCDEKTLEKLIRFAARARPKAKVKFRKRGGRWSVEIPKVLEFKDEHTRKTLPRILRDSGVDPEQGAENRTEQKQSQKRDRTEQKGPRPAGERLPKKPATTAKSLSFFELNKSLLVSAGVSKNNIRHLAENYATDRIQDVVKASDGKRNRGGWIFRALTEQWDVGNGKHK